MFYFQRAASIVLIIVFFGSLIYLLFLSIKGATNFLSKKEAMIKTFIATFSMWSSLFLLVIIWGDKTDWNITTGMMVFGVFFLLACILSAISTLGIWLGKKKWKEQ